MVVQLVPAHGKVAWIKERTYLYKIRKNSITASKSNSQKIESLLSILNKLVDDWEQGIISRKYTKEFAVHDRL